MVTNDRFQLLKETRRNLEENYETSKCKIQPVPIYMRDPEKYEKYYSPKLISFGPIHHGDPKLKRGEQYKLMWASMYAGESPELLHQRIADEIEALRGLFSWDDIGPPNKHYSGEDLAWMLFVDGCSVLQILDKANLSKAQDLKVKVDIVIMVQRDILLLENQLPYKVLELLSEDESNLKKSMYSFCELQNMFRLLETPGSRNQIERLEREPPTHLLDCLRRMILIDKRKRNAKPWLIRQVHALLFRGAHALLFRQVATLFSMLFPEFRPALQLIDINLFDAVHTHANWNEKEKYTSYRNIQELKAAAIRVKRQKNINLKNISFSSSFFHGKLHLPPLSLSESTVSTLLNLATYEMCPDFRNEFEISSYLRLLDSLIDNLEDVKELRSSGVLHNSLGSDEEVVELFNTMVSGLVHNPARYSKIRDEVEKHYKNKLRIWMADAYYTYFKSPWTIIAFLAALIALVLTALQTWQAFKSM